MNKPPIRSVVFAILAVSSSLALYNVYADNAEVAREAENRACQGPCVKLIRMERSAFAQTFEFQTSIEHQTTATVRCTRQWVLLGPYACE
jgi:hypothetical protein